MPHSTPELSSPTRDFRPLSITSPHHHHRSPTVSSRHARFRLPRVMNSAHRDLRRQSLFPDRSSGWESYDVDSTLRGMEKQIEYLTSLVESIAEKQQQQQQGRPYVSVFQDNTPPPFSDQPSFDLESPPSPTASNRTHIEQSLNNHRKIVLISME